MTALLFALAAICGYLVAGFNPAITLSRAIYHKDIRECGSGNAGFTNFKRTFGNQWAWWVLLMDLGKGALVIGLFAWLFEKHLGAWELGAAYTGLFCVLGHAFPVLYGFKGGKGFLVCLSAIWVTDWRVGLAVTVLMCLLLLITRYMSLSTVAALCLAPFLLILTRAHLSVLILCILSVLFVGARHKENFKRLLLGTESKFTFGGKKENL